MSHLMFIGVLNNSCLPDAPTLYEQPQSQVIAQTSTATFTCSASGHPRPVISWLRVVNGSPVPIVPSSKYRIVTTVGTQNRTSSLMILNTFPDDTTTYVCCATNVIGSVNASSTLTVQGNHNDLILGKLNKMTEGADVSIQCCSH